MSCCEHPGLPKVAWGMVLFCLAVGMPDRVRANIGPRWWGDYASQPLGGTGQVRITHEQLAVDLRPLASGQPAEVEATYHLANEEGPVPLDLVFVAGGEAIDAFAVTLDGERVPSEPLPDEEAERRWDAMPAEWKPASALPGVQDQVHLTPIRKPGTGIRLLAFSVVLPAGDSTLSARYSAVVPAADERYPTATWQFLYVLAPARAWKSYGTLDVAVELPDGWEHRGTLDLRREGSRLRGTFSELPADALVVATRLPLGNAWDTRRWVCGILWALAYLGGVTWPLAAGAWARRVLFPVTLWRGFLLVAVGVSTGLLWSVVGVVGRYFALAGVRQLLGNQESPLLSDQLFLAPLFTFLLAVAAWPLGMLLFFKAVKVGVCRL